MAFIEMITSNFLNKKPEKNNSSQEKNPPSDNSPEKDYDDEINADKEIKRVEVKIITFLNNNRIFKPKTQTKIEHAIKTMTKLNDAPEEKKYQILDNLCLIYDNLAAIKIQQDRYLSINENKNLTEEEKERQKKEISEDLKKSLINLEELLPKGAFSD